MVWIRGEGKVSRRAGGGRRRRWRWTEEGKREFRERIERVWQSKGRKEEVEWGEMKGVIQTILREGQEGGREKEEGWWDEECRRGKKEVRR